MSKTRQRHDHYGRIALAASLVCVAPIPAAAQDEDYERIVTIMQACSGIADVAARVTCYDNNIRPGAADAASAPDQAQAPVSAPVPAGFGSEMLAPTREERVARAEDDAAATASVAAIQRLEPGIYLITLADGAQWRFVDAAPSAWNPPRPGDEVELERGSLGSVFLAYDGQRRLRVRRVR